MGQFAGEHRLPAGLRGRATRSRPTASSSRRHRRRRPPLRRARTCAPCGARNRRLLALLDEAVAWRTARARTLTLVADGAGSVILELRRRGRPRGVSRGIGAGGTSSSRRGNGAAPCRRRAAVAQPRRRADPQAPGSGGRHEPGDSTAGRLRRRPGGSLLALLSALDRVADPGDRRPTARPRHPISSRSPPGSKAPVLLAGARATAAATATSSSSGGRIWRIDAAGLVDPEPMLDITERVLPAQRARPARPGLPPRVRPRTAASS